MTLAASSWERDIPGPARAPIIGQLPLLLRFAKDHLATLQSLQQKYGNVIRLGDEKYPAVIVFGPEYNRQILRDPSAFYSYDFDLLPLPVSRDSSLAHVTNGMPLMNGPRHNDHRSALLPYFHRLFITRYHDACIRVTEQKISTWRVGQKIRLRSEMEQLAMWLATAPVLGLDPQKDGERVGRQLERLMSMLFNPLAILFPYDIPGLPFHRLLKHGEDMEKVVRKVIECKRQQGIDGNDILSAMLRIHDEDPARLSERELIGHTTTMFRGGYNPNGMVLYWSIFLLTQHPEILKNVLAELNSVLHGENPTNPQLDELNLLEGVIKETMRLFPAGTWTARRAMKPFELEGHCLPEGTWVIMSPYITQRMPEIFPQPHKFVPARWASIHPSAYEFMPFSAGPRYCIGSALGIMQLKIALSILLQRFSFTHEDGLKVDCVGLNAIRPQNRLPVTLQAAGEISPKLRADGNVERIVDLTADQEFL
ncbi:MAG: cytochrome P450 [Chloroflexota bacterium]